MRTKNFQDIFEEVFSQSVANEKPFILSTKQKKVFLEAGMTLEQLKQEARWAGFDVILIIDKFEGPVKERILINEVV